MARCRQCPIPISQKRLSNKDAHLNIIIPQISLKASRLIAVEQFENKFHFNYYIYISTGLQINDKQIKIFSILQNGKYNIKRIRLGIINYDLHSNSSDHPNMYGIMMPTKYGKININNKWSWKLVGFLTAAKIATKYNIKSYELPKSSRERRDFQRQLFRPYIDDKIIENTNWRVIRQNKGIKKDFEIPQITVELSEELWVKIFTHSLKHDNLPFIPIVVNRNNRHFVEWVKIICIKSQNVYIGVGFKYEVDETLVYGYCHGEATNAVLDTIIDYSQEVMVSGIELDLDSIVYGHRLLGSPLAAYMSNYDLSQFRPWITNLIFE